MGKFHEDWRGDGDLFELIYHDGNKWAIDCYEPILYKTEQWRFLDVSKTSRNWILSKHQWEMAHWRAWLKIHDNT